MYVVAVTVFVKPGFADQFVAAVLDNARNTRKEPGNVRFDVLRAEDDPNRFLLYEVYHRKEDFAAHQQNAHYHRFRDAVADWMAQPRAGVKHVPVFYGDGEV
jgi:autoinducer 2-degrading protein